MTINTTCGKIAKELEQSENTILSDQDIRTATKTAGIMSKMGQNNYLGNDGYLAELGYIKRHESGWTLTPGIAETKTITLEISSMNYVEVSSVVRNAVKQFGTIVEMVEYGRKS